MQRCFTSDCELGFLHARRHLVDRSLGAFLLELMELYFPLGPLFHF